MRKVYLVPNLFTLANLFSGTSAILLAIKGDYIHSSLLILAGGFFDFLDGLSARMLNAQSSFGLQLDSLSDITTFGLAPAILGYTAVLKGMARVEIVIPFLFVATAALRLARFNVQTKEIKGNHFIGLPTPAAAGAVISLVLFSLKYELPQLLRSILPLMMILLSYLMVSRIPYLAFKQINLKERKPFIYLVTFLLGLSIFLLYFHLALFLSSLCYVSFGLLRGMRMLARRFRIKFHRQEAKKRRL